MWLPDDDQTEILRRPDFTDQAADEVPAQRRRRTDQPAPARDYNDDTDQSWIGGWFLVAAILLLCSMLAFCTRLHA